MSDKQVNKAGSSLDRAHDINKILMRKIHSVCEKYNITYFFDSGSLIGAIRSQSFVPWDDDIDLAFKREDFNKLLEVPEEEWGEDFELITSEELVPDGFLDFVTRVVYLKATVPLKSYDKVGGKCDEKYVNKLGVDCFILDEACESRLMQKLLVLRLTAIYGMAMGHRPYIDYSEYSLVQRIVIFILSHIGKMCSLDKLRKRYNKVSQSVKKEGSRIYYSNYPMDEMYLWHKKEWFEKAIPIRVDDDWFYGPNGYDDILRALYGDYMQLPPEEARVPKHVIMEPEDQ